MTISVANLVGRVWTTKKKYRSDEKDSLVLEARVRTAKIK